MPTTCGFEELRDHRPAHDALAVEKLRAAGANIFGKTNLPPGATDHQTYNALFGITRNPWNLDRTVGGSSGGSAAAVATGMSALELGSDIGGSIRVPAHFCGVCGHKSSYGLVTSRGQIPPMPGRFLLSEMSVAGPLARSPEDLELALDNLNGPDELEAGRVVVTLPPARHKELREFRVGLRADGADFTLDGGYRGAIEGFADDLRRLGVTVDEHARPAFDPRRCYEDYLGCLFGIIGAAVPKAVLENFDHAGVVSRTLTVDGRPVPYFDNLQWPGIVTVANLPATAVPTGRLVDGLPAGIQLIGPYLEDRTPLRFAQLVAAQLGCFRPPPAADGR
jgi:amidase